MEIYILRHGQTVWNKSRLLQGSRDIELCEEGKAVARERRDQLKDVDFDVIYSSPLKRAYETACIIRGDRDIPIIKDDRLREINFGENEGKSAIELEKDRSNPFSRFFHDPANYEAPKDGESFSDVCKRTREFVQEVIEPARNKYNRVLIAGHGAMNKGMLCYILNHGIEDYWSGSLQKNCGIIIIELDENGYRQIGEI